MYLLINGSPKNTNSNSLYFLNNISDNLDEFNINNLIVDNYNDVLDNIKLSHTIVMSFPLYVDSPPSIVIELLDRIIKNNIKLDNINMYFIINSGFREGEQNITALNIMKRFCSKVNANYKGSLLIGAGEIVGKSKYKLISRKALKELNIFSVSIKSKENVKDIITTIDLLNNKIYCKLANISWNKKCKRNNLTKENIRKL